MWKLPGRMKQVLLNQECFLFHFIEENILKVAQGWYGHVITKINLYVETSVQSNVCLQ